MRAAYDSFTATKRPTPQLCGTSLRRPLHPSGPGLTRYRLHQVTSSTEENCVLDRGDQCSVGASPQ